MGTFDLAGGLAHLAADPSEPILDQSIGEALRVAARRWPDRAALVEGVADRAARRRWTLAGLLETAEQVARALLARFAPGDHVAIWAANVPEWVHVEFGAALAGMTLVTVNPAFLAEELAFVLRRSRARGLIVQDVFRGRDLVAVVEQVRADLPDLREIVPLSAWPDFTRVCAGQTPFPHVAIPDVAPDDVAQIQFTSGTTGTPKGARLTHRGLANNARLYAQRIGATDTDVWVNPMPLFHTAGCALCTLGALQTGGTQVLLPAFDPELMLQLLEEERGTITLTVPTMLGRLFDSASLAKRDLRAWRLATLGGAPVAPELVRKAEQIGVKASIGFGQTEASPYLTHTRPDEAHPDWTATVGSPLPRTEIKIVDPASGATARIDAIGEICARGYGVMKDYFDDPDGTRRAIDADGWLHTGDLGCIDAHGYLRVQGRLKDMIIRGGENIYPREIEDVLFEHPDVGGVAVVGVPDDDLGEVPVGFVQLRAGARPDAAGLETFCRARLASFKVPRVWHFVDRFPQTASGKIQKFALREAYLSTRG